MKRTRKIIQDNKEKIEKLALALLDKETLDLQEIIEVLGEREYPFPEAINSYLDEIKKRKDVEAEKKREEISLKEFEENSTPVQVAECNTLSEGNFDRNSEKHL